MYVFTVRFKIKLNSNRWNSYRLGIQNMWYWTYLARFIFPWGLTKCNYFKTCRRYFNLFNTDKKLNSTLLTFSQRLLQYTSKYLVLNKEELSYYKIEKQGNNVWDISVFGNSKLHSLFYVCFWIQNCERRIFILILWK